MPHETLKMLRTRSGRARGKGGGGPVTVTKAAYNETCNIIKYHVFGLSTVVQDGK